MVLTQSGLSRGMEIRPSDHWGLQVSGQAGTETVDRWQAKNAFSFLQ